jgi:hypothetical protein
MGPLPQVQESGKAWGNFKDDVTTLATITAVRPSLRDKLLPPEGDAPSAAVTCSKGNLHFIDKLHKNTLPERAKPGAFSPQALRITSL